MSNRQWIKAASFLVLVLSWPALAGDWNNAGGNSGRNGLTDEVGPDAPDLLWSGGRSSIIAWQPVIEDQRVFMVRQTGFPPEQTASPVVAMDLSTGAELWTKDIPAESGDWTTWIAGARDGRVYAARSGDGSSVSALMYALDAANGNVLWISQDETSAGSYDGVVFADNGDLVVADFRNITRIRATDGTTIWRASRLGSVSGTCGGAIFEGGVYVADAAPGGTQIKKYDLASGMFLYGSPIMPGFTIQNTPLVGPDGTIYLSRTQNNPAVDFFYAFADDGVAMIEKWHEAAQWGTTSEFAADADSVYMVAPGNFVQRRNADTGELIAETEAAVTIEFGSGPRMAVDAQDRLFLSNDSFSGGRFYSFNGDLTPRWDVPVTNVNIGAPAIGQDGTLIVCGVGNDVRAYRTPRVEECDGDVNGDNVVDLTDLATLLSNFGLGSGATRGQGDLDGDADVDLADLATLLANFGAACP